jgi:hypothetical protein
MKHLILLFLDLRYIGSDSEKKMNIEVTRNALGLGLRLYVLVKRLKPSEMHHDDFRIK